MDYPTKEEAQARAKVFIKKNRGLLIVIGALGALAALQHRKITAITGDLDYLTEYTAGFKKGVEDAIKEMAKRKSL